MSAERDADLTLGPFQLWAVETGRFRLDAGAMLGVVPKTLWSRVVEVDEKNRMLMASRSLLIRSSATGRVYLVDNGCGEKFNEKMTGIYGIDYEHSNLLDSLAGCGVTPEEVTDLIFTHLHFDHCGGTTYYKDGGDGGELAHRFPGALYHVTASQLDTAVHPNGREKASFLADNIGPISESDRLVRVGENNTWEEGFSALPAFGHTLGMQLPVIEADGITLVFMADLLPTRHHLPLPWVMGYDMDARQTLREKAQFLDRVIEGGWYLFMQHDPEVEVLTVTRNEKGHYAASRQLTLSDLA